MAEGTSNMASDAADEDTLTPLRAHLDPKTFGEIVSLYRTTVGDRAAALVAAAETGDLDAMRRNAHDLAGMCGQLGAARTTALARRIEHACVGGKSEEALALVPDLGPAVAETLASLAGAER